MTIDYAAAAGPVLRKAADLIEDHGWATGALRTTAGCLCVHGAISMASGTVPMYVETKVFSPGDYRQAMNTNQSAVAAVLSLHEYMSADPTPYDYYPPLGSRDAASCIASWNDCDVDDGDVVVLALRNAATWAEGRVRASA